MHGRRWIAMDEKIVHFKLASRLSWPKIRGPKYSRGYGATERHLPRAIIYCYITATTPLYTIDLCRLVWAWG